MQGTGGRKIPLLPARLPAFLREGVHSLRLFLQDVGKHGARPLRGEGVVQLAWRSLTGLGRLSKRSRRSGKDAFVSVMPGVRPRARARLSRTEKISRALAIPRRTT